MRPTKRTAAAAIAAMPIGLALLAAALGQQAPVVDGWAYYGHDPGGTRYSPLTDITTANVSQLTVAWTFRTGDAIDGPGNRRSGFEATPILVDGALYVTTGRNRIIALNPETGAQLWSYDPQIDQSWGYGDGLINRGVATWVNSRTSASAPCRRAILEATLDARLIAVDAVTGKPCADFGRDGAVDLSGVERYRRGVYHMTSPPAVVDDVVVVGSSIDDGGRSDMPAGVVRAYDARTGVLRWKWDPVPAATGAANAWSVMAVDPERHLVFVPTGSASPDYFGGSRNGDNKWANSIVALRAASGDVAWGFQLVHHDLWDYDTAAPPLLATIVHGGRTRDVVIQGNKTGFLYVLDRDTGAPVFGVEEKPVPASDVPGEMASRTQPVPLAPPAVTRQRMSADEVWGLTPEDREQCRAAIAAVRNEGLFTPPSERGSLIVPGNVGGMNWSGYAFAANQGVLVVNTNELPAIVRLIPRERFSEETRAGGWDYAVQAGTPFGMARRFIQAPSGLPCSPPPWGQLTAVDLASGKIRWQVPLGSMSAWTGGRVSLPPGSVSLGGPIVTASGVIFIAGSVDARLHAFDLGGGRELWSGELPANGNATPMTYKLRRDGRQFVVVAAGGHAKVRESPVGDTLVAFALPRPSHQGSSTKR